MQQGEVSGFTGKMTGNLEILCGKYFIDNFNHQQTSDSTGKFVFNRFRTQNSWFMDQNNKSRRYD